MGTAAMDKHAKGRSARTQAGDHFITLIGMNLYNVAVRKFDVLEGAQK